MSNRIWLDVDLKSEHKVALVTGASQRIGSAIAKGLHSSDLNIVIHYSKSKDQAIQLEKVLNAIRSNSAIALQADLQDLEQIRDLAKRTIEAYGQLDVLINNASVFLPNSVSDTPVELFDELSGIHLKAPYFLVQSLLPQLRSSNGCVVNISDIYASRPLENYSLYCTTKAALEALTKALALELSPEIRVNAIAPGAILWPKNEPASLQIVEKTPLKRIGDISEMVAAVKFLVFDATFTTGHILSIDGGRFVSTP